MTGRDIIVVGASAGGIQPLEELVRGLPADLPASVFVVVHTSPSSSGVLPTILSRSAALPCEYAVDGRPIRRGRVYIAPPDHHLLLKPNALRVSRGPKENGFRPAVDPLFRTAAQLYGPRVIGVVLSGSLDDGTMGSILVKRFGGVTIAQDPREAAFPSMPHSAIQHAEIDHVLTAARLPAVLSELAAEPITEMVDPMARAKQYDPDLAEVGTDSLGTGELPSPPSGFTCPECGGALWELKDGKLLRYRCHVGHGFTAESLEAEQSNGLEAALWAALRALEENAALRRKMADRMKEYAAIRRQYESRARDAEVRADVIRKVLVGENGRAGGVKPKRNKTSHAREIRPPNGSPRSGKAGGEAVPGRAAKVGSRRRNTAQEP